VAHYYCHQCYEDPPTVLQLQTQSSSRDSQLFAHHPTSCVLVHFLHLPESLYCLTWWWERF
jgi:hypothetical protein